MVTETAKQTIHTLLLCDRLYFIGEKYPIAESCYTVKLYLFWCYRKLQYSKYFVRNTIKFKFIPTHLISDFFRFQR